MPIVANLERVDCAVMPLASHQACSTLWLPPAQHSVGVSTDQQISLSIPGDGKNTAPMADQALYMLSTVCIPHEQFATALTTSSTGQLCTIGAPGRAGD